jgi:nucleotide-binding universal stress UspA family protein
MDVNKRILLAVEDSEDSNRAVVYVATMVGKQPGVAIRLFHVLAPMSPELLETPGSENTAVEEKLEEDLEASQSRWLEMAEQAAQPVFAKAKAILSGAGVPAEVIETQICTSTSTQDRVADILEEAQASQCSTIVVGRKSFSRLKELFRHHVGDELVQRAQGFTVWVVE